jgi:tetratricopeptide (TPR) repeat protein
MSKFTVFLVLAFLVAVALFSVNNNDATTLRVPFYKTYEMPKIGVILFSALSGAFLVFVLVALRDTRRFISNYQTQKRQRKEERLDALYARALNGILAGDFEEARTPLEAILKEEPGHTNALLRLGDVYSTAENHEKAVEYYRKALEASTSKNVEALLLLEREMQHLRRWDGALSCIEDILEVDPDSLSALERKRYVLERIERWGDLVEVQKAILKHPHLLNHKAEEARIHGYKYEYARQSLEAGYLDRAAKLFRSVLRYDRDFIPAYLGTAEALLREDETEQAVDFLEKGYEQTGSEIILARLEDLLISLGEPERVIRLYRSAAARRPDDAKLRFLMAKLYYRLEMIDDSFETLRSLEADSYPVMSSLMGELHMRRENFEQAAKNFRKAIESKPWKLNYCCNSCGHMSAEWSGRCPSCGAWNSFSFNIYGRCKL